VKVLNSDSGINLVYSMHDWISDCSVFNSTWLGIWLGDSDENAICNNVVSGNHGAGIGLGGSGDNNNLLADNQVSFTTGHGFDIVGINNTITSNQVWNNTDGVLLDMANQTIVSDNDISNNSEYGVNLIDAAEDNTFYENTIQNNWVGICGEYSQGNSGNNNLFYHNNIIDNTLQLIMPPQSSNAWDAGYPSGGNYWSDYNGTDSFGGPFQNMSGADGIGDSPYIDYAWNVTDRYPLMGMFSDFNATSQRHVQTVCNSTISDFHFNGTALIFNVSGENGTTGFCRICIPAALINGTLRVFVNGTEVPYKLLPNSNSTQSYLYFTYHHSTQEVVVAPEFPTFIVLPFFLIAALMGVALYKKKANP
jgi:parallel beta-helix repeat protein